MANQQRDGRKEHFWRQTLTRWQRSGLTIRDYCSKNGLSEASMYAWRRTIAQRDQEARRVSKPTRRRSRKHRAHDSSPTFLPVHVVPTSPTSALEIVLRNGRILRLAADIDLGIVGPLLDLLDNSPC